MKKTICVIGACNIDITATSKNKIIMGDSNPGQVETALGGVGRNIAQNLSQLGFQVAMLTALSTDAYGILLKEACLKQHIDLSHALISPNYPQSLCLYMNDCNGDSLVAINQMDIVTLINTSLIEQNIDYLNSFDYVVFDTNLTLDTIDYIVSHVTKPLIVDGVSSVKCEKLKKMIEKNKELHLFLLKLNKIEAEMVFDCTIHPSSMENDLSILRDKASALGIKNLCITLGKEGAYLTNDKRSVLAKPYEAKCVNSNGAGDAFLSGITYGYSKCDDNDLTKIINYGFIASKITIEDEHTVSENCNEDNLIHFSK